MDIPMKPVVEITDEVKCVDYIPRVNMTFTSENEAFEFYNRYGGIVGFTVRRDSCHKNKDNILTNRRFVCNKHGHRPNDKRDGKTLCPRPETRTGCPARMAISLQRNGLYLCKDFVEAHNHELHTPSTTHYMRSKRKISDLHAFETELADDTGIGQKATFDYMGLQAEGNEYLGYTRIDLQNYLRTKRQHDLAYGEAGCLVEYFIRQIRLNPAFTFSIQYDNEEKITNIFWADPRMIIDYSLFGDVVSFDTTFCTNRQCRPLGIFVGYNHHKGLTVFGAALLYDETVDSFRWLFQKFLEAHGQKYPITIFTNQDTAMARAIADVLPNTWHGLCTWHLMQNGIRHLGNLMKSGSSFLTDLSKCIYEYDDENDFEVAWRKIYEDYAIENTLWLDRVYQVKEKWAKCYMKNIFTLGCRSTQLSESINGDLKDYVGSHLDFVQFFKHFERVLEDKRGNELKAEFDARNQYHSDLKSASPILRQTVKVYTPKIFKCFKDEYEMVSAYAIKSRCENDVFSEYVVGMMNEEEEFVGKEFKVIYKPSDKSIECSCKKFESFGILCCHTLKILDHRDKKSIPETYILQRWKREARSMVVEDSKGKEVVEDVQISCTQRYRFLCKQYIKILEQASNSSAGFEEAKLAGKMLSDKLMSLSIENPATVQVPIEAGNPLEKDLQLKKK